MKIAVFGTGEVGTAIATRLRSLDHDVVLGSRNARGTKDSVRVVSHKDAAAHGEWVVNAMHGEDAMTVLPSLDLRGKLLIDQGNWRSAIDQPILKTLGESLQAALPQTRVVKAMNFVSAELMGHPQKLDGNHTVFVAGNDKKARSEVSDLLRSYGWRDILDLGDLTACRAMESMAPLWIRLNSQLDTVLFDIAVVRRR
jgi:8-hydroxy-5-deazaflavin:NADPH oxidoreductase